MEFIKELTPQFDNAKSFYRKARVYRDSNGTLYLKSYETIVAEIKDKMVTENNETQLKVYDYYSVTTARHINEFIQQYGFDKMCKKDMEGGQVVCKK